MKITTAYQIGNDLHLQCECSTTEEVYGVDRVFTVEDAVVAFKARHAANHRVVEQTELPDVIGVDID